MVQVIIALVALVLSGVVTLVLAVLLGATVGWRVSEASESEGIDLGQHRESAYDLGDAVGTSQPLMRALQETPRPAIGPNRQPRAAAAKE